MLLKNNKNNLLQVKNLLAWRIGAIQLTEPLFYKLDIKYLEDADNPIVRQAVIPENKPLPKYIGTW